MKGNTETGLERQAEIQRERCIHLYIYIYIYRERETEIMGQSVREMATERDRNA